MLVRQLSYFIALATERHFARAAAACNIAQPTLSAAIRKLEEELQVQLVIRGKRFVGLTPEGERVLVWGRQILADYGNLLDDLSATGRSLTAYLTAERIAKAKNLKLALTAGIGSAALRDDAAYLGDLAVGADALRRRGAGNSRMLFRGRPIRDEYLIVHGGALAGAGVHSYSKGDATGGSEEAANYKKLA